MPNRLIILIYLLLTYSGGLWAPLGSLIIILIARLSWREQWIDRLGLRVSQTGIWLSLLALILAAGIAWIMIPAACLVQGIEITPIWERDARVELALHTLGQTFNEEIVLGWMLLASLRRRLPRLSLPSLSIAVALIFAGLHFTFYAVRPQESFNNGILCTAALLSVFAVGVLRNNFILGLGNIVLAWGVHLGWNLIFIDSAYQWAETGERLTEPEIFNAVFGYTPIVSLLVTLMGLSLLIYFLPSTKLP